MTSVFEVPTATSPNISTTEESCGFNCDWGFGIGVVIVVIGPLPGPC